MKKLVYPCALAAVLLVLAPTLASAESLRCKGDIVNVGDSRAAVLQRCGEPVSKDSFCKSTDPKSFPEDVSHAKVIVLPSCQKVDQWTYNPGYGQFMTFLIFDGEKVATIKYGYRIN